jgi:hypothetical protein
MNNGLIKQSILFCIMLVVILVGIEWMITFGVRESHYSHYYKVNQIASHKTDPQVACFGSSVGEVSLNTTLLENRTELSVYNFCLDGTRFRQYNGLIRELNDYSVNCKLVVMAETFFSLSAIDQLTEPDRYIAHLDSDHIYQSLHDIQPGLMWKIRYVPFYKFIVAKQPYYRASFLGLREFRAAEFTDSLKGFTPKYKEWELDLDSLNNVSSPIDIHVDSATIQVYKRTIDALRRKGRKVLIIIPPIQSDGLKLLPGLSAVRNALASLQGKGVYFRDFSVTDISLDKRYFYNNSHVNSKGAKVFSERLGLVIDSLISK